MGAEPWIDPDGAEAGAIVDAVHRCPSGALTCTAGGADSPKPSGEPAITVSRDGPYFVTGGIQLRNAAPDPGAPPERYALCRCGGSKNKPFCDGTHWHIGFADERNRSSRCRGFTRVAEPVVVKPSPRHHTLVASRAPKTRRHVLR